MIQPFQTPVDDSVRCCAFQGKGAHKSSSKRILLQIQIISNLYCWLHGRQLKIELKILVFNKILSQSELGHDLYFFHRYDLSRCL